MFFKELEVPLNVIKKIMENPNYDREQVLLTQKSLLERKRNRLNGIIELINDVMKGVNTMSFEAFTNEDVQKIVEHTLECMSKERLDEQVQKFGSEEKYKKHLASGLANEHAVADVLKWYGGKDKAMEAGDKDMAHSAVLMLAENYKAIFALDNARNILLDLAKEYLQGEKLAEATDSQFGKGCSEYVAHAIMHYYGVEQ